jgi:hypothetical protein
VNAKLCCTEASHSGKWRDVVRAKASSDGQAQASSSTVIAHPFFAFLNNILKDFWDFFWDYFGTLFWDFFSNFFGDFMGGCLKSIVIARFFIFLRC